MNKNLKKYFDDFDSKFDSIDYIDKSFHQEKIE